MLVEVSAPVPWLPAVAFWPDHAPDAVHDVASVDDHVSVDESPRSTDEGLALKDTVGGCGGGKLSTTTVTEATLLKLGREQ